MGWLIRVWLVLALELLVAVVAVSCCATLDVCVLGYLVDAVRVDVGLVGCCLRVVIAGWFSCRFPVVWFGC